jgi:NADH-quinone oxidoreductase subunit J
LAVAVVLFGVLGAILLQSKLLDRALPARESTPVHEIGVQLMTRYILPLEVLGVLLTAAVIGAVILARPERKSQ